jgi:aldehyde:ferredoxin oxidoreductase
MATKPGEKYEVRILRVDLTSGRIDEEQISDEMARKYVGGNGLGAKFLYEEVPPGVEWSDPANRMMLFSGPLGGTKVVGSGTFSAVSKGPATNTAGASQANGYFGPFLKSSGFDGIIIHGVAKELTRLHIKDGKAELLDAKAFRGKDTWETEDSIRQELGKPCSVYSIGPAGENLVRFACIVGDHGHVAAHNGLGAVMGSKKLKAVSVERGKQRIRVADPDTLSEKAKALYENNLKTGFAGNTEGFIKWGTPRSIPNYHKTGWLPVRNYTTNIFPEHEKFTGQVLRTNFKIKAHPCWACRMQHANEIEIPDGPYKGFVGEEPDYESVAAMSSLTGQTDTAAMVMLANLIDRLGMDVNETGYVIAWLMECYEKGFLKKSDLDGIAMDWGNVEAMADMLKKIAHRQGSGQIWAEGVKRAAEKIGGEALNCAVYTQKGNAPRGHDHRSHWWELMDTCLTNVGAIECIHGHVSPEQLALVGVTPVRNGFDPEEVSTMHAKLNGRGQFIDCLGVCRFCVSDLQLMVDCVSAVTGWDFSVSEAMDVGRRTINQFRVFNFRHGLRKEMEAPSVRYGSAPVDGPVKGVAIMPHWETIRRNYYKHMGWDPESGRPLPETLERLGLGHLVQDLKGLSGS